MRRLLISGIVPAVALFTIGCSDASAPVLPDASRLGEPSFARPAAGPAIDGVITAGEYDAGATITFSATLPNNAGTAPVTVFITRDRTYLYLAMRFDRGSPFHANDIVAFEFDNDNDGVREDGDDGIISGPGPILNSPQEGGDVYRTRDEFSTFAQSDELGGGTTDVIQAYGVLGTVGTFEMRKELDSGDSAHDFTIDPMRVAQTVGLLVQVSLENDPVGVNSYAHTFKPTSAYCQLTVAKKSLAVSCPS
jgi:hypothetical protein